MTQMTLQTLIEKCFLIIYFLIIVADIAIILKICRNVVDQYNTQWTTRFNQKTPLPEKNKIKGLIEGIFMFFCPIINLIVFYYLVTRTEDFYELAFKALDERYNDSEED